MNTIKRITISLIFSLALLIVTPVSSFAQCPMCRATVESSLKNGESKVGLGLNDGILYLLSMPYLALALIAFIWYRAYKKNKAVKG